MRNSLKTLALTIILAGISILSASAKGPEIKFDSTKHDFGIIHAKGAPVTATYAFTNTGDEPLIIVSVTNGGCGCTKPSFTPEPIAPGKSGEIKITFNPAGRKGELNRSVKVQTNASKKRVSLSFKGVVVPD